MSRQTTDTILMVRPAAFGYNELTEGDNAFQKKIKDISVDELQKKVLSEFDGMVDSLKRHGINVLVKEDTKEPIKTDAIFPNNWISTTPDGIISIYPMFATNRRAEKRDDIIQSIAKKFQAKDVLDWSELEAESFFLEGTGSMVIDHDNHIIYSCVSQRTHPAALEKFASRLNYKAIMFECRDEKGIAIYHTNVLMCIGEDFAIVCEECFIDELEWIAVSQLLRTTGHRVITITLDQLKEFAGNMLAVRNNKGEKFLVMSQRAHDCLTKDQLKHLKQYATPITISIPTIETLGGGSVRCMMAEIFLSKSKTQNPD